MNNKEKQVSDKYDAGWQRIEARLREHEEELRIHPIRTRVRDYLSGLDNDCFHYVSSLREFGGGPCPGENTPHFDEAMAERFESMDNNWLYKLYSAMPLLLKAAMAYGFWLWYQVILGMPNESTCVSRFPTVRKVPGK